MQSQIKSNSGAYLLEVFISKPFKIKKGRFAGITLPQGYYYYAGSAQKNLHQRLSRHSRKNKALHWHIDYITAFKGNKVTNCWIFEDAPKETECLIIQRLIKKFNFRSVIKGFGSSDCRHCETHFLSGGMTPPADITFYKP
ncbi:MAG: GIY-YIG nuclease family protein [Acidobacteriota bacterium]